jgi:hypothetical protein
MLDFMKKITDWILEKEAAAARQCTIPVEEIQSQIEMVEKKREKLTGQYQDAIQELDHVEKRLQKMKRDEELKCNTKGGE